MMDMFARFNEILPYNSIFMNEPLKRHTTLKVGGPADWVLLPQNISQIKEVLNVCMSSNTPYIIIGNGSNLLVNDAGYKGVVIKLFKQFSEILVTDTSVCAQSGALLSAVASTALKNKLKGFEFASGIPGTVGGGLFMNAGAYGCELKDLVAECTVIDTDTGEISVLTGNEMQMSYRHSIFHEKSYIIVSGTFDLEHGRSLEISELMSDLNRRRASKQPLSLPSAGSTFKRPEGYYAAKLIEDCGLKGFTIGGAQVSEKHSGFIVNIGGATAKDLLMLIEHCISTVEQKYGVTLEPEVRIIG